MLNPWRLRPPHAPTKKSVGRCPCAWLTTGFFLLLGGSLAAAERPPRAEPPRFSDADQAPFFADAFAELVGPRPAYGLSEATDTTTSTNVSAPQTVWSQRIDEITLETEIKRLAARVAQATRSGAAFKGGESRQAADALAQVALAMGVIARHDGRPRWRDEAPRLAPHFAASARLADAATDGGYQAAQAAAEELAALVRGERPALAAADETATNWGALAPRSSLMRRMKRADEEFLPTALADRRAFRRGAEDVRHEAQVLAMLATAIVAPGADDADDPGYQAYARQMGTAAERLADAAEQEDLPAATQAAADLRRSCTDCHADYRG
ncbi:cytochrome c [Botrimarina hoheduenensis]|uniref:Cytochrome C n=1 Tax=Botrimarina hoheduenensis TaxID=2528000 RepID=A0A5C5W9U7_9BACT|nr:cytochrome c [Botrimarina hoheduenensis]TWT46801.1 Cytochrome C' [Botrimarina hoheduenensis]